MKIAIIADWLTNRGGAEHVVEALAEAFPEAPIYTSVYNQDHFPDLKGRLRGSFLMQLPASLRLKHQWLLPLLPKAFQALDLSQYDVVISSSSAFAKCLTLRLDQAHICYCHTPTRYLYHAQQDYKQQYKVPFWMKPFKSIFWNPLMAYLTRQDQKGAKTVTQWIANSNYVAQRIKTYYDRTAKTIYPCIDTTPYQLVTAKPRTHFLAVGRFIPYKKFDLLVHTFALNGLPLKLAGIGPELDRCKKIADEKGATNIEFLGFVPTDDLPNLYATARAFLFPAEEDFGLTPVEAMSSGTPVIYYEKGGAIESVAPKCGVPFTHQTVESLQKGIDTFIKEEEAFDPVIIKKRGIEFDRTVFIRKMKQIIDPPMKFYIGSDHAGYSKKEAVKAYLESNGHDVTDVGTHSEASTDYPIYGEKVGTAVMNDPGSLGIVTCGSGVGISIAANKIKGIRCVLCDSVNTVVQAREHGGINVLAIAGRGDTPELGPLVDAFINTKVDMGERHERRRQQLNAL